MKPSTAQISVVRHSFFRAPGGTLRYTEHSPESFEHERQICNCTRSISEKPEGTPHQVSQQIKCRDLIGDYLFEVSLDAKGMLWFKFSQGDFHAYFMTNVNGVMNSLNIEIILPKYGHTGCFFGRVYFGNKIDTSRFMNGGWPSKAVDLNLMTPKTVWAHYCSMGEEAVVKFRDLPEAEEWRSAKTLLDEISKVGSRLAGDQTSTVDGIRIQALDDPSLVGYIATVRDWFHSILKKLKTTEMFRACAEAYTISEERLQEKHK